ncbi:hypothetical protein P9239_20355 [Caballeronia sp. LZ062]|uniref:hypothetical protein n=1 Tax=unclassified Caballeronia TaxID=2646786 RepID=UPI00285AA4A8|nr:MULTISPECIES: hypothetical protein [unclassified Caballeronia]MDR5856029.1 hypothetical protein [Caballeronia sp. LZ050]MDR5872699.1 hypothetical protein [Caballeronia sp. LZ062]
MNNETWQYQVRIRLDPHYADLARKDPHNAALSSLNALLEKHDAELKCQFDAFAEYVAEAEREGTEHYPLYRWTRETIENPVKKAKYLQAFTFYVRGAEVYDKALADDLEADLVALKAQFGDAIIDISKFDTNPASNPQPPSYDKA